MCSLKNLAYIASEQMLIATSSRTCLLFQVSQKGALQRLFPLYRLVVAKQMIIFCLGCENYAKFYTTVRKIVDWEEVTQLSTTLK